MTVKELKEKLECLIEEGIGEHKIILDGIVEMEEDDIYIDKENKEVWI